MTTHPFRALALGGMLTIAATAASAAEIILFDGDELSGEGVVFRGIVPNLGDAGFNDRAASISVRDGVWEVCSDADFEGVCTQLPPGDYRRLEPPIYRRISSLRLIAESGYSGSYGAPPPVGGVGIGLPGIRLGINLPGYPVLSPIPGYPVYYAPQVNANYFFYDGLYWIYQQDNWYASSWYNGPWSLVSPAAVPLFLLRVPIRYYRQPPPYFRGWRAEAPPRWGERWGREWEQSHRGWDSWNRGAVPPPAPLPSYQQQYSGNRYPRPEQQPGIHGQNYRYQPHEPMIQRHYDEQRMRGQPGPAPQVQRGASPGSPPPRPDERGPGRRGDGSEAWGQGGRRPDPNAGP